jgi:hypothetical protein
MSDFELVFKDLCDAKTLEWLIRSGTAKEIVEATRKIPGLVIDKPLVEMYVQRAISNLAAMKKTAVFRQKRA